MKALRNRRVVLGVTGGIAAYKSADLTRRLRDVGADVQVVMTAAAARLVGPLTFQALSGRGVGLDPYAPQSRGGMDHIDLARWADVVVVAPASANFMARLAHGMADDLLTTLCLATEAPLVLAPAMNRQMWLNRATQFNCRVLEERGVRVLGPVVGEQACGELGVGRMLETAEILEALCRIYPQGSLVGVGVVVSAGPTREPVDPVRFLSNCSSGKMGFAVAAAAAEAGADVTLVSGPVSLTTPPAVRRVDVVHAEEMAAAILGAAQDAQVYIGAAAVADYRPVRVAEQKIKKTAQRMTLQLERTPDILELVARLRPRPFLVGFAAETEELEEHAEQKLHTKSLDLLAANRVGGARGGFDSDENALRVLWVGGGRDLGMKGKRELARELVALIAERYHEERAAQDTGSADRS
jgi:phosphopantothenoylcysteine decarboxylase/phosphopantothenate--cysteine ligase